MAERIAFVSDEEELEAGLIQVRVMQLESLRIARLNSWVC